MHYTQKNILAAFVCLILLVACGKKQEENALPEGMMDQETFVKVLRDFALAESAANINIKNANLQKLDSVYAFNPLEDNGVTQVQYDSAVAFYARHPELYKKVYENVLESLNQIQAKRNPLLKDSISK
jgi:hypothetical protein